MTTETVVTDADLRRAHAAAEPEPPADGGKPAVSRQVMAAYRRARAAGAVQNARSRQIVAEARQEREGEPAAGRVVVPAAGGQTTIADFGGVPE